MMNDKNNVIKGCLLALCSVWLFACGSGSGSSVSKRDHTYWYGVTLDSMTELDATVSALAGLARRPITRVVFDEKPAKDYSNALSRLHPHTKIMGQLFDSEYINHYNLADYQARVDEYLDLHGDVVDVWEIGNEVNGEWTGDPKAVAEKTQYAFEAARSRGYKTALTLYYNDYAYQEGCWQYPREKMRDWARSRLNASIKAGVDYVLLSYYEEDCDGYRPSLAEWENVFAELGGIFPQAKLGFGEVGSTGKHKISYFQRYYHLDISHPRYIGGHFWWYFKDDMVPSIKPLWNVFNELLKE